MSDSAAHVAELIADLDPGAFVTKFVVVAEVIDADGDRAVWRSCDPDSTSWDLLGLLNYALEKTRLGMFEDEED